MKPALAALVLLPVALLLLAPCSAGDDTEGTPSPVGTWRLDRDAAKTGLEGTRYEPLSALLVPDLELRVFEDGRFEGVVQLSGIGGEAQLSCGTWMQSREVVSFAMLRDDGQPGSLIGRLLEGRLVLGLDPMELPLERVAAPQAEAPEPTEEEDAPRIGIGPGPSIRIPQIERDDGSWPVPAITALNFRRVAERTATEVSEAMAKERGVPLAELWPKADEAQVLHIESASDAVGSLLEAWGIEAETVSPLYFLEHHPTLLPKARVVFAPSLDVLPRALETSMASALRAFVEAGGYLVTTNRSVRSVLAPAFPTLLTSPGREAALPARILRSRLGDGSSLLEGVERSDGFALWCGDGTYDLTMAQSAPAQMLVASDTAIPEREQRERWLVFATGLGNGRVLHSLPELVQRRGSPEGAHHLQRIVLNFVRDGLQRPR